MSAHCASYAVKSPTDKTKNATSRGNGGVRHRRHAHACACVTTDSAGPPWTGWKVEVGATGGSAGTEWSIFITQNRPGLRGPGAHAGSYMRREGLHLYSGRESGSGGVGGDGHGDGGTGGGGRMNH